MTRALPDSAPAYLTAEDVARLLQVSEKSVFRWASEDATMPALRIGRTLRFPRERLERWLASREQGLGRAHRSRSPSPVAVNGNSHAEIDGGLPAMRPSVCPESSR